MATNEKLIKSIYKLRRAYKNSSVGAKEEIGKTLGGQIRAERKILNKFKKK